MGLIRQGQHHRKPPHTKRCPLSTRLLSGLTATSEILPCQIGRRGSSPGPSGLASARLVARLGLRLGEACGLQWQDFNKDAGTLTIERQWTRLGEYTDIKTAAARRRIPLSHEIRDELIALYLRSSFSGDVQPIFASTRGAPLTHRNVTRRGFEAAAERAGIEGVSFHKLRHAAASRLIEAGLSPVVVAKILGHAVAPVSRAFLDGLNLALYKPRFDRRRPGVRGMSAPTSAISMV